MGGSPNLVELNCGGRITGESGEKPSKQCENDQERQLTYGNGPESSRGYIGGRRALSPLRNLKLPI